MTDAPPPRLRIDAQTRGRVANALKRFPQGGTISAIANAAACTLSRTLDALHDLQDLGHAQQTRVEVVPELWRPKSAAK